MRSSAALFAAVLLVFSSALGVGIGVGHSAADGARALGAQPTAASTAINASSHDGTTVHVSLRENGDARWNVTARFVLRDGNETAAFRRLAEKYEQRTTDAGFDRATFARFADYAADDAGRPMEIRNATRSSYLRNNGTVGLLSLSFTWTNFTHVEGERVVLGDVFETDSGLWLPSLGADQTLVISGPDGYYIMGASPSGGTITGGNTLRYQGPQTFEPSDLSVTYAPRTTTTSPGNTTETGDFPDFSGTSGLLFVLLVFGVGGFGAYAWSQRRDTDPDTGDESGGAVASTPTQRGTEDEDEESDEDDEPSVELLSDEERVLRLLRDNDGRMKQANIVRETNWSNAKVSQLLSKMDDDGAVNKLRIGRENLITLPDEDVTDVD